MPFQLELFQLELASTESRLPKHHYCRSKSESLSTSLIRPPAKVSEAYPSGACAEIRCRRGGWDRGFYDRR